MTTGEVVLGSVLVGAVIVGAYVYLKEAKPSKTGAHTGDGMIANRRHAFRQSAAFNNASNVNRLRSGRRPAI